VPRFTNLKAWRKAHDVSVAVYELTKRLPRQDRYDLGSQMRRAAFSAAANLAEGRERETDADFAHFVTMSAGSTSEVQYYLILCRDLRLFEEEELRPLALLAAESQLVTNALRDAIRKQRPPTGGSSAV
jgi:four helix bundle protein